jgi:hypothetical protein
LPLVPDVSVWLLVFSPATRYAPTSLTVATAPITERGRALPAPRRSDRPRAAVSPGTGNVAGQIPARPPMTLGSAPKTELPARQKPSGLGKTREAIDWGIHYPCLPAQPSQ